MRKNILSQVQEKKLMYQYTKTTKIFANDKDFDRIDMFAYFYTVLARIFNFVCILIIGFYFHSFENPEVLFCEH